MDVSESLLFFYVVIWVMLVDVCFCTLAYEQSTSKEDERSMGRLFGMDIMRCYDTFTLVKVNQIPIH